MSLLKINHARLRDRRGVSADRAHVDRTDEIFGNDGCGGVRLFLRLPGNPPNTADIEEGEKESISGVENNRGDGGCRGGRTISAVPGEGGGRRRLSSALRCFRFSEDPVCFATRGEPACSTYISAKVGATFSLHYISVADRVPRKNENTATLR